MFTGFSQMVEEINSSVSIIDNNKERNLQSTDPVFLSNFKKEWDEITSKLKEEYSKSKGQKKETKNESIRYSASAIEFR